MIYKPNSCKPFGDTSDLVEDLPFILECQIDSSNIQVRGYSIKILNSDNNQVYPRVDPESSVRLLSMDDITIIYNKKGNSLYDYMKESDVFSHIDLSDYNNLNTGYNGSNLVIPFIVKDELAPSPSTVRHNQLCLIENGDTYTLIDEDNQDYSDVIFNGGSYKWILTLYELQLDVSGHFVLPTEVKYYDMILTTGTVLGSNYNRIQSYKSDNIYQDYYIQLGNYFGGAFTPIGRRVRIKGYDQTFGYIYPETGDGGFEETEVVENRVKNFRIYELSNNVDNISDKNKVDYVYCRPDIFESGTWNALTETEGNSFLEYTYSRSGDETSSAFHPFPNEPGFVCQSGKTRVAFIGNFNAPHGWVDDTYLLPGYNPYGSESTYPWRINEDYGIKSLSPLNGIYIPYWTDNGGGQYNVRWSRSPDADTIGELMNKTICIQKGDVWSGKNLTFTIIEPGKYIPNYSVTDWNQLQINKTYGSVGYVWSEGGSERGVNINSGEDGLPSTIGTIFYNHESVSESTPTVTGRLYLRPFVGLESGMMWQEIDGTKQKDQLRHRYKNI